MVVLGRGAVSYERGTPVAAAARFGMTLEPLPSHAHVPPVPGDTVPCKMGQSREFSPVKGYLGYEHSGSRVSRPVFSQIKKTASKTSRSPFS